MYNVSRAVMTEKNRKRLITNRGWFRQEVARERSFLSCSCNNNHNNNNTAKATSGNNALYPFLPNIILCIHMAGQIEGPQERKKALCRKGVIVAEGKWGRNEFKSLILACMLIAPLLLLWLLLYPLSSHRLFSSSACLVLTHSAESLANFISSHRHHYHHYHHHRYQIHYTH